MRNWLSGMHPFKATDVIARAETFGGILFHPTHATFLDLDAEAFACAVEVLSKTRNATHPDEQALMDEIRSEFSTKRINIRLVKNKPFAEELPGVLAAPTLVDFQITERCMMECPHCYASASPQGRHAEWNDVLHALGELQKNGVCQIALGGGEPLLHPHFSDILAAIRAHGMVPNLTTTGQGMTKHQLNAMKKHCGAVAVSLESVSNFAGRRKYGLESFLNTVKSFQDAGINLVFQVTLSASNLAELDSIVELALQTPSLYGVIFLAYKPAGRGTHFDPPLSALPADTVQMALLKAFQTLRAHTRVGYDCCLTPGIVGMENGLGFAHGELFEGCSAARSSLGLTPNLEVLPCTFLPEQSFGNLHEESLADIWRGSRAQAYRRRHHSHSQGLPHCQECRAQNSCLGGCPAWNLISCAKI